MAQPPTPLAGETVLEGAGTGYISVVLPRPLTLSASNTPGPGLTTVDVTGTSPVVGIYLVPEEEMAKPPSIRMAPQLMAYRFQDRVNCPESCEAVPSPQVNAWVWGSEGQAGAPTVQTLPAGLYRLYLFTNPGEPAVATITADGEEGSITLRPTHLTSGQAVQFGPDGATSSAPYLEQWAPLNTRLTGEKTVMFVEVGATSANAEVEICGYSQRHVLPDPFTRNCTERAIERYVTGPDAPPKGVHPDPDHFVLGWHYNPRRDPTVSVMYQGAGFVALAFEPSTALVVGGYLWSQHPPTRARSVFATFSLGVPSPVRAPEQAAVPPWAALPRVVDAALRARKGRTRVRLRCDSAPCTATVSAGAGSVTVRMRAGATRVVSLRLSPAVRRTLRKRRRAAVTIVLAHGQSRFTRRLPIRR